MTDRRFQGTFMMLHVYAAILAAIALSMHTGAVWYHLKRLTGM